MWKKSARVYLWEMGIAADWFFGVNSSSLVLDDTNRKTRPFEPHEGTGTRKFKTA